MIEVRTARDLLGPSIERGLIKLWERQTGRDSSSLSPDERKALIDSKKMELKTMQDEDEERRREYLRRIASEE